MSKTSKSIPKSLDAAALEEMVEPLTIQIQRQKNGLLSPIPMPIGESGLAGVGWSKAEVLAIDQGWLVNSWSGGGYYVITVTDDTRPAPKRVVWSPYWDPALYPEKIPPTLADSARPGILAQPPAQPQPSPQPQLQQVPMSQFPAGLPAGGLLPMPQAQQQPQYAAPQGYYQQPQQAYYGQQQQPQPQGYNPAMAQMEADRRRLEEQVAAMAAQLRATELESVRKQYAADLERERTANAALIQRLEQRISEFTASASSSKVSPEVEAMREQMRAQQAQLESEKREREAERREREMRELVAGQNAQIQRQIETMQQQYQVMIQAQQAKGPDPFIQMMMEQQRTSMEAMKEISRQSSTAIDKFQAFMMSPRDVMSITKDASNGLDNVTQKMTQMFSGVFDLQNKVLESAMNLNQGGNDTVGLIREGVTNAKDLFERYIVSKSREAQVTAQAGAATAQANAQATAVRAQADVALAHARRPQQVGPVPSPAPARPAPTVGLGGPAGGPGNGRSNGNGHGGNASFEEWNRSRQQPSTAAPQQVPLVVEPLAPPQPPPAQNQAAPSTVEVIAQPIAKSDQEWFGPLLPEVIQLRRSVDLFFIGLRKQPPVVQPGSADPAAVAKGIAAALQAVMQHNIPIPALNELLAPGDFEGFFRVLLPAATPEFHADAIHNLKELLGLPPDENEEEDDGFEDGDSDDVRDGASA